MWHVMNYKVNLQEKAHFLFVDDSKRVVLLWMHKNAIKEGITS